MMANIISVLLSYLQNLKSGAYAASAPARAAKATRKTEAKANESFILLILW
jgi:hypothetical protein